MINETGKVINEIRKCLRNKVMSSSIPIESYEDEKGQIYNLLKQTLDFGESNSALLIGPRGVGKTTLVNSILCDLQQDKSFSKKCVLVKLNGLIQTDDRLALKSATSQMNLDNAVDGKVFGSFAENLAFLLACLKVGQKDTSKSVIFVIDEFDLFCSHHNQTLLYNLFDVSQSAQTPICVFGITCRLDVIELLEKRVKSRFSHRQIFMFAGSTDDDEEALVMHLNKIKNLLSINNNDKCKIPVSKKNEWNKNIKELLKNTKLKQVIQRFHDISLNEQVLKNILINVVIKLDNEKHNLSAEDFMEELSSYERDDLVSIIQDLSVLELCLLISMKHHVEIYDNHPMNFEMVYTRFAKFASANSNMQFMHRSVVMKAFEHLQNLELTAPITSGGGRLQKEYQMFKLLVTSQQITEAVKLSSGLPTEVVQWAISSLV